jgi:hypothetical protein
MTETMTLSEAYAWWPREKRDREFKEAADQALEDAVLTAEERNGLREDFANMRTALRCVSSSINQARPNADLMNCILYYLSSAGTFREAAELFRQYDDKLCIVVDALQDAEELATKALVELNRLEVEVEDSEDEDEGEEGEIGVGDLEETAAAAAPARDPRADGKARADALRTRFGPRTPDTKTPAIPEGDPEPESSIEP